MAGLQRLDLIEAMIRASDPRSRFADMTQRLNDIGLDSITYAVLHKSPEDPCDSVQFFTTLSDDFMDHYRATGFEAADPHVKRLRMGLMMPYEYCESDIENAEASEQRVLRAGVEAGLRSTLCIPLAAPLDPLCPAGAINLGSSMAEVEFKALLREHGPMLVGLAHVFHYASIRQILAKRGTIKSLSVKERDCLSYLAMGLRQDAIAYKMGLALVSIEAHLRNARRKLHARTASEAVAKALLFGEIQI